MKCIICKGKRKTAVWHPGDDPLCMQCEGTGEDKYNDE